MQGCGSLEVDYAAVVLGVVEEAPRRMTRSQHVEVAASLKTIFVCV